MTMPVVGKRRAGVEVFVNEVVVTGAVILVGARLHGEVKKTAASLAELCRVVAGLNRDLLDRFDAGLVSGGTRHSSSRWTSGTGSRCILPFHADGLGIPLEPIDADAVIRQPGVSGQHSGNRVHAADAGGTHGGVTGPQYGQAVEGVRGNVV